VKNKMTITEKIKSRIAVLRDIDKEKIFTFSHLENDLNLDSLDTVEFAYYLEREFDIEINEFDIKRLFTVLDVIQYIKGELYGI